MGTFFWIDPKADMVGMVWTLCTANWARGNQCATDPVESVAAVDVARLEYPNCADDAAVVLYTIGGGGHSWPGGKPMPEWLVGATNRNIDATGQMWAFFREHPLPRKIAAAAVRR